LLETGDAEKIVKAETELKYALAREDDNPMGWRLLSQAYASQGKEGEARLASAEYWFALGQAKQANEFALRARDMLDRSSIEWRRATDIVLSSGASESDILEAERRNERRRSQQVLPPNGA
ncbi:MAG: M48 family peptidase, partial [Brevundimonas sp.]